MTMQTLHRVVNRAALPTLMASTPTARAPITIEGHMGVPRVGWTEDSSAEAGSLPSRAMENTSREPAVWMARVQTKMAMATSTSSTLPQKVPSTAVRT